MILIADFAGWEEAHRMARVQRAWASLIRKESQKTLEAEGRRCITEAQVMYTIINTPLSPRYTYIGQCRSAGSSRVYGVQPPPHLTYRSTTQEQIYILARSRAEMAGFYAGSTV